MKSGGMTSEHPSRMAGPSMGGPSMAGPSMGGPSMNNPSMGGTPPFGPGMGTAVNASQWMLYQAVQTFVPPPEKTQHAVSGALLKIRQILHPHFNVTYVEHTHLWVCTCVYYSCMCVYPYVCIFMCVYIHICVHSCVCIHMCAYRYVCVLMCVCAYSYVCVHSYVDTDSHVSVVYCTDLLRHGFAWRKILSLLFPIYHLFEGNRSVHQKHLGTLDARHSHFDAETLTTCHNTELYIPLMSFLSYVLLYAASTAKMHT